jgi:hypothetical protein
VPSGHVLELLRSRCRSTRIHRPRVARNHGRPVIYVVNSLNLTNQKPQKGTTCMHHRKHVASLTHTFCKSESTF